MPTPEVARVRQAGVAQGFGRPPTMSVVVPTRNRASGLAEVLAPLLVDGDTTELIVVDDGSMDGTPALLAHLAEGEPRLRVLRREGIGAAAARQVGAEAATGEVVLFVDDDVVAAPGLVTRHRGHHAATPEEVVVVGYMPVRRPERRQRGDAATLLYDQEYEACCRAWELDPATILTRFWAGNVSLRRARCVEVPLPSPHGPIAYHEDEDFGLRLRAAGVAAVFDRTLRAEHRHHRPMAAFLLDAYRQGADRWHLRNAYPGLEATLGWSIVPRPTPLAEGLRGERAAVALLTTVSAAAGWVHAWSLESAALRFARRLERRRGYRDAARGVRSVAVR